MQSVVTVAIPTLNAGPRFPETLAAVRAQRFDGELQLLVCDSGSEDGTVAVARAHEADLIEIPRASFSHGGTRNLLMSKAAGTHVAFLTQDAVPAREDWLARLLASFTWAPNVGLAFGPYRPRPGASLSVTRELTAWFDSFSTGARRIDVLDPPQRDAPPRHFLGHLGFFTDANGCVSRAAWEQVPFRRIDYAEDHVLAQDMLRAGFAKVYVPDAPVIHSHEYSPWRWLRRSFDESRAMREVYGWAPSTRELVGDLRGGLAGDVRFALAANDVRRAPMPGVAAASLMHHMARTAGRLLGAHADGLPRAVAAKLSLEGRSTGGSLG